MFPAVSKSHAAVLGYFVAVNTAQHSTAQHSTAQHSTGKTAQVRLNAWLASQTMARMSTFTKLRMKNFLMFQMYPKPLAARCAATEDIVTIHEH